MTTGHARRIQGTQVEMIETGLDLLVFAASANMSYLTGVPFDRQREGAAPELPALFIPARGRPILALDEATVASAHASWPEQIVVIGVRTAAEALKRAGRALEGQVCQIGTGGELAEPLRAALAAAFPAAGCCSAQSILAGMRRVKDANEIAALRKAAAVADAVMAAVVPRIKEGVTQLDLERELVLQGTQCGAEAVSFPPAALFTAANSEVSDDPFTYPKEKGLVAGTTIAFDFGFVVDGYCSDFGRSFHLGPAPAGVKNACKALHEAVCGLVAMMKPGALTCGELFPAIERLLDAAGFGDYLRARLKDGTLGHQIGLEVHEDPWLKPGSPVPLERGMVMAIEPKLWHAGQYYLRVEDIVLIGHDKAEFLTTFDRGLFEV